MRIKLELDPETTEKLIEAAVREKRPAAWQAEVLLRTALGLPFPPPKPHQPAPSAGAPAPSKPRRQPAREGSGAP